MAVDQQTSTGADSAGKGCLGASLVTAGLLYAVMLLFIADLGNSDAAGRALTTLGTMLVTLLVWGALGAFTLLGARQAGLRGGAIFAALLFVAVSAAASLWAIDLMSRPEWIRITPILLPLVAVAFVWTMTQIPEPRRRLTIGCGLAVIAAILWVPPFLDHRFERAELAELRQEEAAEHARQEAEFRALLVPESRLDQLLPYLQYEPDQRNAALAMIRRLNSRQADAVRLLGEGRIELIELAELHDFNLTVTPELCRNYGSAIERTARAAEPGAAMQLDQQDGNMRWLVGSGCDLSQPLTFAAGRVRAGPDAAFHENLAQRLEVIARGEIRTCAVEPTLPC